MRRPRVTPDLESPLLHERLRAYRIALGWTQERLAYELDMARPSIAMIETGRVRPTLDVFFEICKLFDADPVAMYRGKNP